MSAPPVLSVPAPSWAVELGRARGRVKEHWARRWKGLPACLDTSNWTPAQFWDRLVYATILLITGRRAPAPSWAVELGRARGRVKEHWARRWKGLPACLDTSNWTPAQFWDRLVYATILLITGRRAPAPSWAVELGRARGRVKEHWARRWKGLPACLDTSNWTPAQFWDRLVYATILLITGRRAPAPSWAVELGRARGRVKEHWARRWKGLPAGLDTSNWTPAQFWDRLVYATILLITGVILGVVVGVIATATVFRDEFRALAACANFSLPRTFNHTPSTSSQMVVRVGLVEGLVSGNLSVACAEVWAGGHGASFAVPLLLILIFFLILALVCVSQRLCAVHTPPIAESRMQASTASTRPLLPTPNIANLFTRKSRRYPDPLPT